MPKAIGQAKKLLAQREIPTSGLPSFAQIVGGSLVTRYRRCGKPTCHCVRSGGHGPAHYLVVTRKPGKTEQVLLWEERLWELLAPGEGELTAVLRLLQRLLPRLRQSPDLILGDALYGCRPFFRTVYGAGLEGLAISSGETERDEEIDLWRKTDPPRRVPGMDGAGWKIESEAGRRDLKRKLRVIHGERRYEAPAWKPERKQLRVATSLPVEILPAGQGWKVGRSRGRIENGTFNLLTRHYSLTPNYHHARAARVALLAMRSFACFPTQAYWRYATARSPTAPARLGQWFQRVLIEAGVRYRDQAWQPDRPYGEGRPGGALRAPRAPDRRARTGPRYPPSPDPAAPKGGAPLTLDHRDGDASSPWWKKVFSRR